MFVRTNSFLNTFFARSSKTIMVLYERRPSRISTRFFCSNNRDGSNFQRSGDRNQGTQCSLQFTTCRLRWNTLISQVHAKQNYLLQVIGKISVCWLIDNSFRDKKIGFHKHPICMLLLLHYVLVIDCSFVCLISLAEGFNMMTL